jgi:hypothetical protein
MAEDVDGWAGEIKQQVAIDSFIIYEENVHASIPFQFCTYT